MQFSASVSNIDITNNSIYDDGAGYQAYAIGVGSSDTLSNAVIAHNQIYGNTTAAYDIVGTVNGIVWDNGTQPAFTISGCSATGAAGSDNGTFTSGTTGTCTVTVTPNGTTHIVAPHGYTVSASDLTTPAAMLPTAITTTSFTISGSTTSADTIQLQFRPF
ncbi:MAG TPA: hypothetical protein VKU01_36935 [Bryobacteraceae bacterium]|nr:hypothetical protein [Bryobacteraceae bacterium]